MNKLFQKLAIQAGMEPWGIGNDDNVSESVEEFAKLIVQECIERLQFEGRLGKIQLVANPYSTYKFAAFYDAANILSNHFGVKSDDTTNI